MLTALASAAVGGAIRPLAEYQFGDTLSDGIAGPMGLLIIVLLAIATVFLVRNMNARLKRLPDRFPDPREERSVGEADQDLFTVERPEDGSRQG